MRALQIAATGMSAQQIAFFRAENITKVSAGGGDASEKILIYEVPLAKAHAWLCAMQKKGKLVDPKVYSGLFFLQANL